MIIELTARLLARPERAWAGLVADGREEGDLPSPAAHAATLAGLSVIATFVGASLEPGRSVGGVVVDGLTAIVGYVGAVALAVVLLPRALARAAPVDPAAAARFGSASILPLASSGVLNVLPLWGPTLALTLLGTVLTARSAWIGAHSLLGWSGGARWRASALVVGAGLLPLIASTAARAFLIR